MPGFRFWFGSVPGAFTISRECDLCGAFTMLKFDHASPSINSRDDLLQPKSRKTPFRLDEELSPRVPIIVCSNVIFCAINPRLSLSVRASLRICDDGKSASFAIKRGIHQPVVVRTLTNELRFGIPFIMVE